MGDPRHLGDSNTPASESAGSAALTPGRLLGAAPTTTKPWPLASAVASSGDRFGYPGCALPEPLYGLVAQVKAALPLDPVRLAADEAAKTAFMTAIASSAAPRDATEASEIAT
jgi:hypothetical protein